MRTKDGDDLSEAFWEQLNLSLIAQAPVMTILNKTIPTVKHLQTDVVALPESIALGMAKTNVE
ncbi:uncharacterized protein ACLA_079650 [Aspergillus clavatus NRRL 1]|uniref:Uncharacterized protein n=1 Tax=Aspergillus clavatus (strain ATCC 1007 / CBS 513.65 / DSM 816 / NCTC 3887 / NRRL 1 / QM 1276 / 107) TaxID=344612 RepID=A1CSJ4_ASPCL|nr:uncharacterized protein ACLA_079650 [Aspergillus clavatus NRRL 1]EAW06281.1 hypothetical protein ACLA_079650 [Aspergillus clavatus NRRL 1]